jgi:hypothetical protein
MRKQTNQTTTALPRMPRLRNFTLQCRFVYSTKLGTSPGRRDGPGCRRRSYKDLPKFARLYWLNRTLCGKFREIVHPHTPGNGYRRYLDDVDRLLADNVAA